jgi:hypothetical protein
MMEITLEEIQKKFDSLPEDLKWAIMAANVDDNIIEIGQMQGLNVEQMGQLSLETHMVMFGFTHPDKFEESVRNSMKLGDEKTRLIVNAVNEKILKEIKDKMMQMYDNKPEESEKQEKLPQTSEEDSNVLNSHGIEIIPEKKELNSPLEEYPSGGGGISTPSSKLATPQEGNNTHTVLEQKLSGSFQNSTVKTEHTLNNLTKMNEPPISETPKPAPSAYPPKGDPYRLPPE